MAKVKYKTLPDEEPLVVNEPSGPYGITIPVTIPTMGDYTLEALTHKLTDFALRLVAVNKEIECRKKQYSDKLLHLRSMSKNRLTTEDISQDERLAYIINK